MSNLSIANLAGRKPRPISSTAKGLAAAAVVLGIVGFLIGVLDGNPTDAWAGLLTNYMLFTQFGILGILFGAIANITNSTWMRPLKRIAESFASFLPVSFVLLIVLFIGRHYLWGWISPETFQLPHDPEMHHGPHLAHVKHWWLNEPFFWGRQLFVLAVFNLLAVVYRKTSRRPDEGAVAEVNKAGIAGWKGLEAEVGESQRKQKIMAPMVAIAYGVLWTFHSFDMMLSIDWTFPDAMFGGWQFSSGLLAMWCLANLFGTYYRKNAYLDDLIGKQQYHDLGKLIFGFGIFWMYIVWAQYLPIWYGNLPEEAPYLILRIYSDPWRLWSLALPFIIWLIPFWVLMPAANKMNPKISGAMALLVLIGLWMERYVVITATLSPTKIPYGIDDILMTLGFAGAFIFLSSQYLRKYPVVTLTDPYLKSGDHAHH